MLPLNEENCRLLRHQCYKIWPDRKVRYNVSDRRGYGVFFFLTTPLEDADMNLHYEYSEGHVEFHIEQDPVEYIDLINELHKNLSDNDNYRWQPWQGTDKGRYTLKKECNTIEDVIDGLKEITYLMDPLIKEYKKTNPATSDDEMCDHYKLEVKDEISNVENEIKTIKQLDWARLNIPAYQRPYKWTAKNVNQLITDINSFKNYSAYRIGTLVLHNHGDKLDIVDGQQRMVTLSLLLFYFFNDEKLSQTQLAKNNADLKENVIEVFAQNIKFNDRYSLYNVIENWNTIDTRKDDLTEDFYDFLLNKCQMVEVTLTNLSEAFQFFDSQNARGKDLEPHDLLKAFHLREIVSDKLSASDKKNLTLWQDTPKLSYLFQLLYQAKNWSLGNKAWTFTKDQIMEFKGVSLNDKNKKRYPFYQLEIIAHVYLEYYTKSPDRIVDGVEMEYPYNLDDQIINGSRFFDMIRHYLMLYDKVCNPGMYKKWTMAYDIMEPVINNTYQGAYRTGDQYVRSMFITTLIYYVDRFGFGDELNRIVPKIFLWAYSCRLKNRSVRWNTVENYVIDTSPMLSSIHKSHTPEDILNITIEAISENEKLCGKCDEIKKIFRDYNKLI